MSDLSKIIIVCIIERVPSIVSRTHYKHTLDVPGKTRCHLRFADIVEHVCKTKWNILISIVHFSICKRHMKLKRVECMITTLDIP